jgi:redox-sensitive bicupin YhaK (pirin superfamily)
MEGSMPVREISRVIAGQATADGAGVRLRRSVGAGPHARVDPFLMLDEFHSADPGDYIAGFPPHPHRGFETVTIMLEGRMRHEDNLGNRGDLGPGDVQWMSAARGIIHSEMPQQEQGRMRGFQLWVNLPAKEKMRPAAWRDIPAARIPQVPLGQGVSGRLVRGQLQAGGQSWTGPADDDSPASLLLDLTLAAGAQLVLPIDAGDSAFLYLYEGAAATGPEQAAASLPLGSAAVLGAGGSIRLAAGESGARVLVAAGRPLGEPVAQLGPFVMNTRAELEQAVADYQAGRLSA